MKRYVYHMIAIGGNGLPTIIIIGAIFFNTAAGCYDCGMMAKDATVTLEIINLNPILVFPDASDGRLSPSISQFSHKQPTKANDHQLNCHALYLSCLWLMKILGKVFWINCAFFRKLLDFFTHGKCPTKRNVLEYSNRWHVNCNYWNRVKHFLKIHWERLRD